MGNRRKFLGFLVMVFCFLAGSVTAFAADTTMKNKEWLSGQGGAYVDEDKDGELEYKSYGTSYYKMKVPKQGYIIVDANFSELSGAEKYRGQNSEYEYDEEFGEGYTNIELLNSSKKTISFNGNILSGKRKISFSCAVKKGTYYLAVSGDQKYKIRYSFTSVAKTSQAGKRLKSAVSLKRGVMVKNLLFDVDSSHYYKISVPKKSKITFYVNSKIKYLDGNLGLFMQILVKKGNGYKWVDEKGKILSNDLATWDFKGKDKLVCNFPRGTYYLRVGSYFNTGYYTLKWN